MSKPTGRRRQAAISCGIKGEENLSHPLFILRDMERQLTLIEVPTTAWKLDDRTREAGKKGIAEARKALADAARRASYSRARATSHAA